MSLKSIKASGDCFYEAIVVGFQTVGKSVLDETRIEDTVRGSPSTVSGDGILALRYVVSNNLTHDTFRDFKMYCDAGLPDFTFMRRIQTTRRLKEMIVVKGRSAGAGHCIWANEFEMRVVAKALGLSILIMDDQGRGSGRFVVLDHVQKKVSSSSSPSLHEPPASRDGSGEEDCAAAAPPVQRSVQVCPNDTGKPRFVILHRTRRQHYNLVLVAGCGLLTLKQLPNTVIHLWSLKDWYELPTETQTQPTQQLETSGQTPQLLPGLDMHGRAQQESRVSGQILTEDAKQLCCENTEAPPQKRHKTGY